MAGHGHRQRAATVAVAALSLAALAVHLPPPTGTHTLTHGLGHAGSALPPATARQPGQARAPETDDRGPPEGGPAGRPGTTPPGGAGSGTGTDRAAAGGTDRAPATPGTGPTTGPGAAPGPPEPGTTAPRASGPSGSPGTGRTGTVPGCPAAGTGIIGKAPGTGRTIALTFDDGPGPQTPAVLDVLAVQHVHATFFVIGRAVTAASPTVTRTASEGHLVGNHTWDHDYPRAVPHGWTAPYLRGQLSRTSAAVTRATGRPTCFFRPPGGRLPRSVRTVAPQLGQRIVLWSVDPQDWSIQGSPDPGPAGRAREADQIYRAAIAGGTRDHPVLLLHDSGGYRGATVAALPRIIAYYRAHGYRFVRLDGRS